MIDGGILLGMVEEIVFLRLVVLLRTLIVILLEMVRRRSLLKIVVVVKSISLVLIEISTIIAVHADI